MGRLLAVALLALLVFAPSATADLLPWPNDAYTKADPTTDTGRRLDLQLADMPANAAGIPVDPTEYNRNDGFSPGTLIAAKVPGIDSQKAFDKAGLVPITDVARSFDRDQPAVLLDAKTGRRQLIWSELEYPDELKKDPADNTLVIHPARNLEEGHRYVVVLRDLGATGGPKPSAEDLAVMQRAHISPDAVWGAWHFTVASKRSLSERMLHIRDDAFAQLGDTNLSDLKVTGSAPRYLINPDLPDGQQPDVDGIQDFTPEQDRSIARRIQGRVLVPCYLSTPGCAEGGSFVYGADGLPMQVPGNMAAANFICNIPRAALKKPGRPTLYGHGLLGSDDEVNSGSREALAQEKDRVMCATDWIGMAQEDIPNDVSILANPSRMHTLADRGQQGMLDFLYLGRSLIHPQGLGPDPPSLGAVHRSRLYYDGGSQGGIMGGGLTAVAPDFTRAALGVPGMNYSILLQRSVDFDTYATVLYNAYPDELHRPVLLSLIQLLWDRAEASGYAQHITSDPLKETPPHQVILDMAYGDHQVTNWATMVEARTIGAKVRTPIVEPFRQEGDMFYGIAPITGWPFDGSELLVSDVGTLRNNDAKGTPPPPVGNEPNRPGVDPHGPDASEQVWARAQIGAFLQPDDRSTLLAVCDDPPCYLDGWDGTP